MVVLLFCSVSLVFSIKMIKVICF